MRKRKQRKQSAVKKRRLHRATGRPRGRPPKYRKGEIHGHHRYEILHGLLRRKHFKRKWLY